MEMIEFHEPFFFLCSKKHVASAWIPMCSMGLEFTYIYHQFKPNIGKYSIHGASGISLLILFMIHRSGFFTMGSPGVASTKSNYWGSLNRTTMVFQFVTSHLFRPAKSPCTVDGRNPANQLIGSLSLYLQGFMHPRWCRISEPSTVWFRFRTLAIAAIGAMLDYIHRSSLRRCQFQCWDQIFSQDLPIGPAKIKPIHWSDQKQNTIHGLEKI